MRWILPLLVVACSDYQLDHKGEAAPTDTAPAPRTLTDGATASDTAPPAPAADCTSFDAIDWRWSTGAPFATQPDPVDALGQPFWSPDFDLAGLIPVALPHTDIPVGQDRVYVARFDLVEIPPHVALNLQSDDGIRVWVNGVAVGDWGGDWQQEGCVNENANCVVTTTVPPVAVTSLLQVGTNHVAARVSNPVANAWFEILPECEAGRGSGGPGTAPSRISAPGRAKPRPRG